MNKQDFQWQYYTFNRTSNCSLWVCQCGFEECLNGYEFGPTIRDHYLIHFVVDGNGTFKSSKGNFPVKKGQGFLITPQEITTYCADQVAPWRYYWVGFKGVEAESLIKLCGISQDKPIFDFDIEKSVSFLEEMLHTDKKSATCEYQMVGYLYLLLSTIMDDSVVKKSKETFTNRYLTKAVEFINQNYNKDINVTKISKEIGIDRTYLYRIFINNINISPEEYLLKVRMTKASDMLVGTDNSILKIATAVGYKDLSHFSSVFKRFFGIAPTTYRYRKGEETIYV